MSFGVTFLISLIIMLVVIVGMGIGVLFGRRPISGSCGGLNQAGGCALCTGTCPKRQTPAENTRSNHD